MYSCFFFKFCCRHELTGVMAPKLTDVIHPRIIQPISGELSLRIRKTNGLVQHLFDACLSSNSSASSSFGPSDIADCTDIIDVGRRCVTLSKFRTILNLQLFNCLTFII